MEPRGAVSAVVDFQSTMIPHGRAQRLVSGPPSDGFELWLGLGNMLNYGQRAVQLVWQTNRALLAALTVLTLIAGLLPAWEPAVPLRRPCLALRCSLPGISW